MQDLYKEHENHSTHSDQSISNIQTTIDGQNLVISIKELIGQETNEDFVIVVKDFIQSAEPS